jgi:hypothetical protein
MFCPLSMHKMPTSQVICKVHKTVTEYSVCSRFLAIRYEFHYCCKEVYDSTATCHCQIYAFPQAWAPIRLCRSQKLDHGSSLWQEETIQAGPVLTEYELQNIKAWLNISPHIPLGCLAQATVLLESALSQSTQQDLFLQLVVVKYVCTTKSWSTATICKV